MRNFLICGVKGNLKVVWTFCEFDKNLNRNIYEWTYGYRDSSWLTEEEAIHKAEDLIYSEKSVKDIEVKQQQGDGSWLIIDIKTSPYAYHNKKALTATE
jgi:hypothetical protein